VLANPEYVAAFSYIPAAEEKRSDLIVDNDDEEGNDAEQSDMVAIIMNLGFVNEKFLKKLKFGPGMSVALKKTLEEAGMLKAAAGLSSGGMKNMMRGKK